MAIMENTSSNMSQQGPNTPGAPATPQDQPATPINAYTMGPGTPGSQSNIGTPNTSHGKLGQSVMASPHPGKGSGQQAMPQPSPAGSMGMVMPYQQGGMPTQQVNSSQPSQQSISHGQMPNIMSPQQNTIRPSPPPPRALIAAKQAEQVARAQAGTRANHASGFVRPVKQGSIQRPASAMGGNMGQTQWSNSPGGDMGFVRQPVKSNIGMAAPTTNATMQQGGANASNVNLSQRNERWMLNNPRLAAQVIKQNRQQQQQQQQRPQGVVQVMFRSFLLSNRT